MKFSINISEKLKNKLKELSKNIQQSEQSQLSENTQPQASQSIQLNLIKNLDLEALQKKFIKILKKYKSDLISMTMESEVSLQFVTDEEIQILNKSFRGKDKTTDVLSWSFLDENFLPHEMVGEIYVSTDTAIRESINKGISLTDFYYFVITHGLLHVYTYDHNTDEEEQEMNLVTTEILENFIDSLEKLFKVI